MRAYRLTLDPFRVGREPERLDAGSGAGTVGFADRVDGDLVGMFAHGGRAYVFVNDARWDVEADDLRAAYRRLFVFETFRLTRRGETVYRKTRTSWADLGERLADPTSDRIDDLGT